MKELIHIFNQGTEFLVDSREVANVFKIQPESLRKSIEENEPELSRLGVFRFQIGKPPAGSVGGRPEKFYLLNFDQIIFLLTLTRPRAETKEYRVRLILAFREAREKLRPIDKLLLSIPEKWRKTFKDEFYIALLNVYGQPFDPKKNKPSWVGKWTNIFIYQPIYDMLPNELKKKRSAYCDMTGKDSDFIKLHQFLEEHKKEDLRDRISKTTAVLQMSGSRHDFKENYKSVFYGTSQGNWDDSFFDEEFGGN